MDVIAVVALLAIVSAAGLWRSRPRRSFAVRRYEHTWSAIDAAVGRARHTGPVPAAAGDDQSHVVLVEPAPRRHLDLVASNDGEVDGGAGRDDAGTGVSSPLAG